jgi:hypothetical protein
MYAPLQEKCENRISLNTKNSIYSVIDIDNCAMQLGNDPMPGQDKAIFVLGENITIPKPDYYKQFKEIIFETDIPFPQKAANAIILASIVLKKDNIAVACRVKNEAELKKAIMISNQFGIPLILTLNDNELFLESLKLLCSTNSIRIPVYPFAFMVKDYAMALKRVPIHISTYSFSHLYSYLKTDYRMIMSGYPIIGQYMKTLFSVLKEAAPDKVKNMLPASDNLFTVVMHNEKYSEELSIINLINTDLTKQMGNATRKTGGYNFLTCSYQHYMEHKEIVSEVAEKYPAYIILQGDKIPYAQDIPTGYAGMFMRYQLCDKYPGLESMESIVGGYIRNYHG